MEQITNYVKPELIVVAIALYFVGMALKQAQADNKCYSCSHVTLDFSGYRYCSLIGWSGFGFTRT